MKSKPLEFNQVMEAIQLEFDFGVMETIDRSLNMPKKQTNKVVMYHIQCNDCQQYMKPDEISVRDDRYCVGCVGS